MTPETFACRVPRLYRLGARGAAHGIRRHGLLTASDAVARVDWRLPLDLRPTALPLTLPDDTKIFLTDNSPLSLDKLARVLDDGLTPADWLARLNARVFFWPDPRLGAANLKARQRFGYDSEWQVYNTKRLLEPVWPRAEIAPINTGATLFANPARRGLSTFAPLDGLDFTAWRRRRCLRTPDKIKEVTVRGSISHAGDALVDVEPA